MSAEDTAKSADDQSQPDADQKSADAKAADAVDDKADNTSADDKPTEEKAADKEAEADGEEKPKKAKKKKAKKKADDAEKASDKDDGESKKSMSSEEDKKWFVVQAFSGFEKQAAKSLQDHIDRYDMQKEFGRILVPTEEVVEMKAGQKRTSERKFFPGYVLVQMLMNDETWHLVKSTPRVSGFIGDKASDPTPLTDAEAMGILQQVQDGADQPRHKFSFEPGEVVRVIEGPFADFNGTVEDVNYEKSKLRVAVSIFGRSTPVELDFAQVEKG